jgi:hypothetical protein
MVLAFSRQMFVEFTVSQTMEHFLACHEHGFAAFGGVPSKIMVDNLKSAVLQRLRQPYYDGLEQRRLNARHHVRKILALAEIYPADVVARAISDGLAFQAFSAEYITNILETELVRCRSSDHCNLPVAATCSTSTSLPRTSMPTR